MFCVFKTNDFQGKTILNYSIAGLKEKKCFYV